MALLCSVPPSGNGKMTMRFLFRSLKDSWKITAGLAMKKVIQDDELCRELFFNRSVSHFRAVYKVICGDTCRYTNEENFTLKTDRVPMFHVVTRKMIRRPEIMA